MYKMGLIMLMKKLKLAVHQPEQPFEVGDKKTPFGFDTKSTLLCGDTAALVFSMLMKKLMKLQPTAIGGRGKGALLMTAIAAVGYQRCRGFALNDACENWEEEVLLAGRLPKKPSKMVLVADVITSGKSLKAFAEEMDAAKHEILAIIPLLDRREELGLNELDGAPEGTVQPLLVTSDFKPWEQDE